MPRCRPQFGSTVFGVPSFVSVLGAGLSFLSVLLVLLVLSFSHPSSLWTFGDHNQEFGLVWFGLACRFSFFVFPSSTYANPFPPYMRTGTNNPQSPHNSKQRLDNPIHVGVKRKSLIASSKGSREFERRTKKPEASLVPVVDVPRFPDAWLDWGLCLLRPSVSPFITQLHHSTIPQFHNSTKDKEKNNKQQAPFRQPTKSSRSNRPRQSTSSIK